MKDKYDIPKLDIEKMTKSLDKYKSDKTNLFMIFGTKEQLDEWQRDFAKLMRGEDDEK